MNTTTARKTVRATFGPANTTIARADRSQVNRALFALGFPTLGAAHDTRTYVAGLTRTALDELGTIVGATRKPRITGTLVASPTREVPEFIVRRAINRERKAALAELARLAG